MKVVFDLSNMIYIFFLQTTARYLFWLLKLTLKYLGGHYFPISEAGIGDDLNLLLVCRRTKLASIEKACYSYRKTPGRYSTSISEREEITGKHAPTI